MGDFMSLVRGISSNSAFASVVISRLTEEDKAACVRFGKELLQKAAESEVVKPTSVPKKPRLAPPAGMNFEFCADEKESVERLYERCKNFELFFSLTPFAGCERIKMVLVNDSINSQFGHVHIVVADVKRDLTAAINFRESAQQLTGVKKVLGELKLFSGTTALLKNADNYARGLAFIALQAVHDAIPTGPEKLTRTKFMELNTGYGKSNVNNLIAYANAIIIYPRMLLLDLSMLDNLRLFAFLNQNTLLVSKSEFSGCLVGTTISAAVTLESQSERNPELVKKMVQAATMTQNLHLRLDALDEATRGTSFTAEQISGFRKELAKLHAEKEKLTMTANVLLSADIVNYPLLPVPPASAPAPDDVVMGDAAN